ncbi:MAG TPA: thioredoxin domain-containing protein [Candidatus Binatia bacterium]|nr:thioredoxin domain-containing protein [Candidatus Binatia bacterium]
MRGAFALVFVAATIAGAADDKVATVGDRTITRAELEAHVRPKLIEIENERYEALREGLDELIAEELEKREAKARGISPEQLEQQEVTGKVAAPTDAEMQKVYDENKAQLRGRTFEQVKPQLIEYLTEQKAGERREAFLGELRKKHKATIALRPPLIEVASAGRPEKGGGAKAPITIIEFSDYECPFCKRAETVVDQVMKTYGDKIRLVFRDYPLPMHERARPAADAANCANAQGKFWEFHAKLFANQSALGDDKLKEYAKELGLDAAKFDQCLATKPHKAAIDKDIEDGAKVGVNGTPAFFVNGRMLSGAQPFEKFKEVIDEELAAKGASPS